MDKANLTLAVDETEASVVEQAVEQAVELGVEQAVEQAVAQLPLIIWCWEDLEPEAVVAEL